MAPDPFLTGETEQPATRPQAAPIQQAGWNAVGTTPDAGVSQADHNTADGPLIYHAEDDPSEVLDPGYLPRQYQGTSQPYQHSTDIHQGGVINTGMMQSPEFRELVPNPTPVEQPPYTYMPDADPNNPQPAQPQNLPPVACVKSYAIGTWLPAGSDDLGMFDIDAQTTIVAPTTPALSGWMLSPGFQVHWLDSPTATDVPNQLYNARIELGWLKQVNRDFGFLLSVGPGIYTDGNNTESDAWRMTGRAIGFYKLSQRAELVAGVAYLDREDITALPTLGIIYKPNSDYRFDVVFPQPKLAYRLSQLAGPQGPISERWAYLKGEFGGGSWAVERANGANDVLTYRDWRFLVGIESKVTGPVGLGWLVEVGYVFNREVEYRSNAGDFDPNSTALLRAGVTY